MATINSYLQSLAEKTENAVRTNSKYYFFFKDNVIIRVSDHISTKLISNTKSIQIVIPDNNHSIYNNKPLYHVFYQGKLLVYNFSELKMFINNFLFFQKTLLHKVFEEEKINKVNNDINEIFEKNISSNKIYTKAEIMNLFSKFSKAQKQSVLKNVVKELKIKNPDFSDINIFDFGDIYSLPAKLQNIIINHKSCMLYIAQNNN